MAPGDRRGSEQHGFTHPAELVARGLATGAPKDGDLSALTPGFAAGLALLLQPQLQVDVSGWAGEVAVHQSLTWTSGGTVGLARRRRARRGAAETAPPSQGGPPAERSAEQYEQEPVVELAIAGDGALLSEVGRALPRIETASAPTDTTPVRIGWHESAAVAHALRAERDDVATHLAGLPPGALSLPPTPSGTPEEEIDVARRQPRPAARARRRDGRRRDPGPDDGRRPPRAARRDRLGLGRGRGVPGQPRPLGGRDQAGRGPGRRRRPRAAHARTHTPRASPRPWPRSPPRGSSSARPSRRPSHCSAGCGTASSTR